MAKPTIKQLDIEEFIEEVMGANRIKQIQNNNCILCKHDAVEFRNSISEKEYRISGMCQSCQDEVFGID